MVNRGGWTSGVMWARSLLPQYLLLLLDLEIKIKTTTLPIIVAWRLISNGMPFYISAQTMW